MSSTNNFKTIVFSENAESRTSTIVDALFHAVTELLPGIADNRLLKNRIKWTATELVINGLKHAGSSTTINITLHNNQLVIEKTDMGKIFSLPVNNGAGKIAWPLQNQDLNTEVFIYSDPGSNLYATITNGLARFWIKENTEDLVLSDKTSLHEHFGLLIITKSADEFSYHYNKELHLNVFTCKFSI